MLDEIVELRGLILLIESGLVESGEIIPGSEWTGIEGEWRLREGLEKFVLPSQEERFVFIEKGHILHMRSNQPSLRVCVDLYFKYISDPAFPPFCLPMQTCARQTRPPIIWPYL
jgi:hypothetical protein